MAGFAVVAGLAGFTAASLGCFAVGFGAGLALAEGLAKLVLGAGFFAAGFARRAAGFAVFGLAAGLREAVRAFLCRGVLAAGLRALPERPATLAAGLALDLDLAGNLRTGFAGFLAMVILAIRERRTVKYGGATGKPQMITFG